MSYFANNFDDRIIELLKNGAVGFMPSDTIYGLSARALDERAVTKLHQLKDRKFHKPFIILISDLEMLNMLSIDQDEVNLAKNYWPGALTLICPAPNSPSWLHRGTQTLAVRIPSNPSLIKLIKQTGPLISTSANIEGQKPANSMEEAKTIFAEDLDFYVDAGEVAGPPSTLAKVANGKLQVIRQGAVRIKP